MFGFTNEIMLNFSSDFSLRQYNTFGFDIFTRYWTTFSNSEQLIEAVRHCVDNDLEWFVLGGGSNIIFSRNYPGVVIHPISETIVCHDGLVIADAGVVWDDLVAWCVDRGLYGLENLSYIPGSVGASPVQNIGAYGAEARDVISWVEYLDTRTLTVERIEAEDCNFGYRESIFKHELHGCAVVLRVALRLSAEPHYNVRYGDLYSEVERLGGLSLENVRRAVINIRSAKLPDPAVAGNAGSFFKNPVVGSSVFEKLHHTYTDMPYYQVECAGRTEYKIPAGWLIDRAGWRGHRSGDAGVHPRQALVLVNYGGATAEQVLDLSRTIIADVESKFGITLEKEVNIW